MTTTPNKECENNFDRAVNKDDEEPEPDVNDVGKGTFGSVRISDYDDDVVVKVCTHQKGRVDCQVSFLREVAALGVLRKAGGHTNVVSMVDFDVPIRSISMNRLSSSLYFYLQLEGQLKKAAALEMARQISEGVAFLHDNGIVHRDLSSNNIVLDKSSGTPKAVICDFGSAIKAINGRSMTSNVTTLPFRAPEMFFGDRFYSYKIDTWAVGILLLEMLRGFEFVHRKTSRDQMIRIFFLTGIPTSKNWPSASSLRKYVKFEPMVRVPVSDDWDMKKLIEWILTLDPNDRPCASELSFRLCMACKEQNETKNTSKGNKRGSEHFETPERATKTSSKRRCRPSSDPFVDIKGAFGWSTEQHVPGSDVATIDHHRRLTVEFILFQAQDLMITRYAANCAVNLLDAFVATQANATLRGSLQDLSLACLLVATKIFDVNDLELSTLCNETTSSRSALLAFETKLLEFIAHSGFDFNDGGGNTILSCLNNKCVTNERLSSDGGDQSTTDGALGRVADASLLIFKPDMTALKEAVVRVSNRVRDCTLPPPNNVDDECDKYNEYDKKLISFWRALRC